MATIYRAECNAVAAYGQDVLMCLTDYRGNRASHDYSIDMGDDSGKIMIPHSSAHAEGTGEATGILRYEFFSSLDLALPRSCGISLSAYVIHTAWLEFPLPAPFTAKGGSAQAGAYASAPSDPCAPPPPPPDSCPAPGDTLPAQLRVMPASKAAVPGTGSTVQTAPHGLAAVCSGGGGGGGGGGGVLVTVEICYYWAVYYNDGFGWYLDHIEFDHCDYYYYYAELQADQVAPDAGVTSTAGAASSAMLALVAQLPDSQARAAILRRAHAAGDIVLLRESDASATDLAAALAVLHDPRFRQHADTTRDQILAIKNAEFRQPLDPEYRRQLEQELARVRAVQPRHLDRVGTVRAVDIRSSR